VTQPRSSKKTILVPSLSAWWCLGTRNVASLVSLIVELGPWLLLFWDPWKAAGLSLKHSSIAACCLLASWVLMRTLCCKILQMQAHASACHTRSLQPSRLCNLLSFNFPAIRNRCRTDTSCPAAKMHATTTICIVPGVPNREHGARAKQEQLTC